MTIFAGRWSRSAFACLSLGLCVAVASARQERRDPAPASDSTLIVHFHDAETARAARDEAPALLRAMDARVTWVSRLAPGVAVIEVPHGTADLAAADNICVNLDDANDGIDTYPAQFGMKNLIVVGASNASDPRWEAVPGVVGSCWGKKHVHLFAPGEDVWHHHANFAITTPSADSGTSLAAPLVSATASMVWGLNPFWTPSQVKDQILSTVDPLPGNFDGTCITQGRLNAASALLGACP